jgi:hypothetical protein
MKKGALAAWRPPTRMDRLEFTWPTALPARASVPVNVHSASIIVPAVNGKAVSSTSVKEACALAWGPASVVPFAAAKRSAWRLAPPPRRKDASGWAADNPAYRQMFTTRFMPDATPEAAQWFNDLQRMWGPAENAIRVLGRWARST